jgi:hypothetical protein
MLKQKIVRAFINFTNSWNKEFHNAIEEKVQQEYREQFTPGSEPLDKMEERIKDMREFYYSRMTNTAVILLATLSIVVALIALLASIFV